MAYEDDLYCVCGHQAKHHAEQSGDDHCLDCEAFSEERCEAFEHSRHEQERAYRRHAQECRTW